MATIDLTLDSFKVPAIENYTPPFGTKIVKTDANKGGLSTVEVNSNIMMPFANMRPKVITENSSTTEIEYDAKLCFSASLLAGATLELDDGAYEGCRVQITNLSSYTCDVEYNNTIILPISIGANIELIWTGSAWIIAAGGLPLGCWTCFENDIASSSEWLQAGTTFLQNKYPRLYTYLGGNTVPDRYDHSRLGDYQSISISTDSVSPTIFNYDGFFMHLDTGLSSSVLYYIDTGHGYESIQVEGGSSHVRSHLTIPFKKGWKMYASTTSNMQKVAYYTHPMFIKAV